MTAAACVIVFSIVAAEFDVFQECMNCSYYESSDHEPPKGLAVIVSQLGWTKTCSGEFFVKDGEAITAFFTLVLGLATIGLWISTRELWKSGEKQSVAIANQSARMSEMATAAGQQVAIIAAQTDIQKKQHAIGRLEFLAVHRPRLRIRHVTLDERAEPLGFIPWDHGDEIKGSLIVVNAGGTKATIIESRYRIDSAKSAFLLAKLPMTPRSTIC